MRPFPVLSLLAVLALPTPAWAVGFGTSYGIGLESSTRGYYASPFNWYPSFDLHFDKVDLQLHPFGLLAGITKEEIWLGGDVYFGGRSWGTGTAVTGVFIPGASLDLVADPDFKPYNVAALGQARIGLEAGQAFCFGLYVVPGFGLAIADDEFEMMLGGRVELSFWLP